MQIIFCLVGDSQGFLLFLKKELCPGLKKQINHQQALSVGGEAEEC